MYSRMREQFGAAGLIVAVVALVAALAGGAYAASGALTGKQKKEVKKIAKQYAGKRGPAGPQGPAGANGKDGSNGAKGDKGDPGAPGANGTNGAPGTPGTNGTDGDDGESVNITTLEPGEEGCAEGGAKFSNATGTAKACSGTSGGGGPLGPGESLTGTWSASRPGAGASTVTAPITFARPLDSEPELVFVQLTYEGPNEFEDPGAGELAALMEDAAEYGCPGIVAGVPQADPGKLCVYGNYMLQMLPKGTPLTQTHYTETQQLFSGTPYKPKPSGSGVTPGVGPIGTSLKLECTGPCEGLGVWAVTAEE